MSAYEQAVKEAILRHYTNQRGSGATNFPVFRGSAVQYGNGIGDIFRSIGRFLLPIFASSAKTFVQSAAKGLGEGQSLKEAAKHALKPTAMSAVQDTTERVFKKFTGQGKRRRRSRKKKAAAAVAGRRSSKRVYKHAPAARKRKSPRKPKPSFKRFIPTNF